MSADGRLLGIEIRRNVGLLLLPVMAELAALGLKDTLQELLVEKIVPDGRWRHGSEGDVA